MVVHLLSPDDSYDSLYLRNYATLKIKDELARLPGVGEAQLFGSGDYAMRIWLDPDKVAARGLTAGDVVRAVREQNVQVSAGQLGAEPTAGDSDFLVSINAQGRLQTEEEFGRHRDQDRRRRRGRAARRRRAHRTRRRRLHAARAARQQGRRRASAIFQAPGANALELSRRGARQDGGAGDALSRRA